MSERQVVVFVRVNNMDTFDVDKQKTFVVNVANPDTSTDDAIAEGLGKALIEHQSEAHDGSSHLPGDPDEVF